MATRLGDNKQSLWSRLKRIAFTDVNAIIRGLNADDLEALERLLIEADFGVPATVELTTALEEEVRKGTLKTEADLKRALKARIAVMLTGPAEPGTIRPMKDAPLMDVRDPRTKSSPASISKTPGLSGRVAIAMRLFGVRLL